MERRLIKTVHPVGMCEKDDRYGEPVSLPDGSILSIVLEGDFGACIMVNERAVRYTNDELKEIGHGNADDSIMSVVRAIRMNPEAYECGRPRPFEPVEG